MQDEIVKREISYGRLQNLCYECNTKNIAIENMSTVMNKVIENNIKYSNAHTNISCKEVEVTLNKHEDSKEKRLAMSNVHNDCISSNDVVEELVHNITYESDNANSCNDISISITLSIDKYGNILDFFHGNSKVLEIKIY